MIKVMIKYKYIEIVIFISVILLFSIAPSKSAMFGGCDKKFMDYQNDVFYLKIQLQRDLASNLPWVATALEGGFEECKEFFRADERLVIKEMEGGGGGWSSFADLAKTNISKSEFCSWNGPFSLYGLGENALRYCKSKKNPLSDISKYSLCKESLNIGLNDWIETNNYVEESFNRGLSVDECRRTIIIEEGLSNDLVIESNDTSSANNPKNKLIELKNLLNEGLITQDQYDAKSAEILDQF